ncbi:MAG: UMP kinase [Firmicutes bacterium]|jgi:uridylate kinase|nr:UMP kinase [Bacillota bacterium]
MIKISGEALSGGKNASIDDVMVQKVVKDVKEILDLGIEVAIVIGGGNFWRGRTSENMERTTADYMGMLATVMNALALQDGFINNEIEAKVMSSIHMTQIAEPFVRNNAVRYLSEKKVVIFAAGTGNPYFSTDTAAALRSVEISADALLLAKNVDGVYDKDPAIHNEAKKFDKLTYLDILSNKLNVMDFTAVTLCMDNNMSIDVFGLDEKDGIKRVCLGENVGTRIREEF